MNILQNRIAKNLIAAIAVINIALMMVFQYGLPLQASSGNNKIEKSDETNVGTIEAVEQETAAKEKEAAETEEDEEEEVQETDAPILELTDDHIYLHVGDRFNYMSYIKTMQDVDGSDLSRYIYLDKYVDTSVPGEIELTYRITSTITGKSASEVLLITITE